MMLTRTKKGVTLFMIIEEKKEEELRLRCYYESLFSTSGRISDTTWWRIKDTLRQINLELSEDNVKLYFYSRRKIPLKKLSKASEEYQTVIEHIQMSKKVIYYRQGKMLSGKDFKIILKRFEGLHPADRSTFYRWFAQSSLGKFKNTFLYSLEDVSMILFKALIYKYGSKPPTFMN